MTRDTLPWSKHRGESEARGEQLPRATWRVWEEGQQDTQEPCS